MQVRTTGCLRFTASQACRTSASGCMRTLTPLAAGGG